MSTLPRLRSNLICNHLDDELLVYDRRDDKVHLLDPITARVLKFLERREGTEQDIVLHLDRLSSDTSGDDLLALALSELRKAGLLEDQPASAADLTRRNLFRKVTLAGAALIPAIVTLSPSLAHGQGSCLPKKACCTIDANCCSNKCDQSTGSGCQTGPLECH
jgi:hypothetical protein